MWRGKTEEKYVDVPGGSIYVRVWHPVEPSLSPPIVLLHDSLGCVALWREFPAQLSLSLGRTVHSRAKLCSSLIAESAQPFIEEQTISGIEAAKQYFRNPINMEKLTKYHGNKARWVLAAWTETWLDPEFRGWNLVCHLKEVQCPVLAIHADNDEYGSVAFPNFIAGSVSGHSLAVIMDGVAHVPHHEDPRKVMEIVKSFLTKGDEHNVVTVSS